MGFGSFGAGLFLVACTPAFEINYPCLSLNMVYIMELRMSGQNMYLDRYTDMWITFMDIIYYIFCV